MEYTGLEEIVVLRWSVRVSSGHLGPIAAGAAHARYPAQYYLRLLATFRRYPYIRFDYGLLLHLAERRILSHLR